MMLRRALVGTLLLSSATPIAVLAQGEELMLEEVIVTASRRTEKLQEVAMSVSAFTGDFLIESGVNSLVGLDQYTPNLQITPGPSSRDTSYRIRGIGSVGSNSGIDPSVGIFLDGIYQGRAGMSIGDLVDVERVEILRGPQGSLYGKNTAAGAISVVTKKPSLEFESLVELSYDSNERGELRGMVNVPLGDSPHAMRLSGWIVNGDHLYENTWTGKGVNDPDKWGGRARFLFDTNRGVKGDFGEFIVTLDYTKEDNDCCAMATIEFDGLSPLNTPATHNPSAAWQAMLGKNDSGDDILRYFPMEDSEGFSPPKADPFGDDYWFDGELRNEVDVGGVAVEWNKELAGGSMLTFLNRRRFFGLRCIAKHTGNRPGPVLFRASHHVSRGRKAGLPGGALRLLLGI
jgi:iron complex outermembrane receptor protein